MAEEGETAGVAEPGTEAIPPRWRGLKRALLVAGLVLVALVALRWVWGCEAQRRLQAKIDEYRAAGEPILIEDFYRPAIPDEENAAVLYQRAQAVLVVTQNEQIGGVDGSQRVLYIEMLLSEPELVRSHSDACARLVAANTEALVLANRARTLDECDWGIVLRSPLAGSLIPSRDRALAKAISGAALFNHASGAHSLAIERLRDGLALADRLYDPRHSLLGYLVADACGGMVVSVIERMAADLGVAERAAFSDEVEQPAKRTHVVALIAELLDDTPCREGWHDACVGECLRVLDTVEALCDGRVTFFWSPAMATRTPRAWEAPVRVMLAPLWRYDGVRELEYWTQMRAAGAALNWPRAKLLAPTRYHANAELLKRLHYPDLTHCFGFSSDYLNTLTSHYRHLARRRMAAVALAIRLYEVDHGFKPPALAELVPDYLPAVPADPFAADGAPLRYAPRAERPVLYSVGPNGEDNGGWFVMDVPRRINWELSDIPFALDGGEAPERTVGGEAPSASQQAVHDDAHVEDHSGNDAENESPDNGPE